jgi:tetratricopeptide (TPR) repeat protein
VYNSFSPGPDTRARGQRRRFQWRRHEARLKEKEKNMSGPARISALAVVLSGIVLSMSGCKQLEARDQLVKGVESYKGARYEEAIGHFQKANQLDPSLPMAKTYLATALTQNVVPGLDTPENMKTAQRAISLFQEVLDKDPRDVNSMKQIAGIYFSIKKLDDAETWQKKVLAVDPKDAEAAYTIGVIDWTKAHQNALKELLAANVNDDGEGNLKAPKKVLQTLSEENSALVAEGLDYLNQAVADRSNYDDAMTYLNLIYRRKADVDYANPNDVKADVASAKDWTAKAMGARKENEEKKNKGPGGITIDSSGNMK